VSEEKEEDREEKEVMEGMKERLIFLNAIMLSVIFLNAIMVSVILLCVSLC
jgi:hypothetical protein